MTAPQLKTKAQFEAYGKEMFEAKFKFKATVADRSPDSWQYKAISAGWHAAQLEAQKVSVVVNRAVLNGEVIYERDIGGTTTGRFPAFTNNEGNTPKPKGLLPLDPNHPSSQFFSNWPLAAVEHVRIVARQIADCDDEKRRARLMRNFGKVFKRHNVENRKPFGPSTYKSVAQA